MKKKLKLSKETLRALRDAELEKAAGGCITDYGCSTVNTCFSSCATCDGTCCFPQCDGSANTCFSSCCCC
jgi:hypothetical protein